MASLPRNRILVGDATKRLRGLPAASVDCVMTSPPYYQLRNYGVDGQIGLEATVGAWVKKLRAVFAEVGRVLKPTGALWLDLGDSYSRHPRFGAAEKSLLLAPERLVLALSADGWIVRNKVIWAKPNAMPHSVTDRLNTSYDVVYFLVRAKQYFFDLHAIREPHRSRRARRASAPVCPPQALGPLADPNNGLAKIRADGLPGHPLGRNPADVWSIPTHSFKGAHFATFPPALVRRPLLATCPVKVCLACGAPWRTQVTEHRLGQAMSIKRDEFVRRYPSSYEVVRRATRLAPSCACQAGSRPGVVLDPFMGAGTVALVAREHRRDWIGIELNPRYVQLAQQRLGQSRSAPAGPSPEVMRAAA